MKLSRLFVVVLAITLLLSGCIPSEYTKGIDAKDYPDRDMPIYDDAVIFAYDADDEEANITYGTEDKLDDVIEFYQDYFDDESIILDSEDEEKDEYSAEGFFEDFLFEINIGEAKGKYEEKLFKTVVEVSIEFLDDEEIEERQGGNLKTEIVGFWEMLDEFEYETGVSEEEIRMAIEFLDDGTYIQYILNMQIALPEFKWEITEEGDLKYWDLVLGDYVISPIIIEERDGQKILYLEDAEGEVQYLFRMDKDYFMSTITDINDIVDNDSGE